MKAFAFEREQMSAICAALIVDELGARFGRHINMSTSAEWDSATPIFEDGADLSLEEFEAAAARIARFFRQDVDLAAAGPAKIGDLADAIGRECAARLVEFSFAPAGGGDEIVHAADRIFTDAAAAANLLYGRRRIISLVSPHSLTGFVLTVLAANLLRTPAIDARRMAPEELASALQFGDAVVATPSLWRYLIAQGVAAPDNAMAVMFGETLTAELSAEIRKAGFGAQREVYGSTETGLIAWRDSPSDAFTLFEHWRRHDELIARAVPLGEPVELTPMDILNWENDRRFRLAGRRDGAVQVGAVNVFPERIAALIAEHPAIQSCVVKTSRHANGGDRLIAEITLIGGAPTETLARSIDSWCRSKLRPQERPRVYTFVGTIDPKARRGAHTLG